MKSKRTLVVAGLWAFVLAVAAIATPAAQEAGPTPEAVATVAQAPTPPEAPAAPAAPEVQTTPRQRGAGAARGRAGEPPAAVAPADPTQPTEVPSARELEENELDRQRNEMRFDSSPVVRVGQDVVVPAGTTVREMVVISGSARIDGRVTGDAVVVLGTLTLGPEAIIDGDTVLVAGTATIAQGARTRRDLVIVGGSLDAPVGFTPGGEQVVIGTTGMGNRVAAVVPWATQGLLLGRPVVPSLPWMWGLLAVVFFVYLVLGFFFERAVRACADAVAAKPLSTFMAGLLVLLLTGPVIFILAVSVVGLIVIPFALAALVIAWIFGKIGVSRAIGASLLAEDEPGNKLQAARSFAIGFALVMVSYMIPVVGMLAFVLVAVFGLGSAWLAMMAGWRRENPAKPKPPRPVPTPPPPMPSPGSSFESSSEPPSASAAAFADIDAGPSAPASYATASGAPAMAAAVSGVAPDAGTLLAMPKAQLMQRAAAFGIDVVLVLFTYGMIGSGFLRGGPNSFFFLLLIYHVVFWTLKGTTVGGIICNLRVIRTDGQAVGFSEALIRGLASILSIVTLGLGCLWIAYDADRQAWHDRIAGTYVVKVPKSWPV
jgi:uncharacterized RDD family membrane protein YckC